MTAARIDDLTPFRSLSGGSVVISVLLALYAAAAMAALGLEAAAIGRGPRLAADLPQLAVYVHARGFTLLGADEALPSRDYARVPCLDLSCRASASYDYDGLTARLSRVKKRWPRQETLMLVPGADVPAEVVLRTVGASTADRRREASGLPPVLLFPDVRVLRSWGR